MAKQTTTQESPVSDAPEQATTTPRRRGPSVNRVTLVGRLTADPELRVTSSGTPVAKIRLATNDRARTEFHDIVAWRQLAEIVAKYLTKGRLVYLEGRLHGRSWMAEDGTTRRSVVVVAENVQFLSDKPAEADPADGAEAS